MQLKSVGEVRLGITFPSGEQSAGELSRSMESYATVINHLESRRTDFPTNQEYQRRISIAQTKVEEAAVAIQRVYQMG